MGPPGDPGKEGAPVSIVNFIVKLGANNSFSSFNLMAT